MPTGPRPAPPAGTCRVVHSGTIIGHRFAMVWWAQVNAPTPLQADLNTLVNQMGTLYTTHFVPVVATDCVMNLISLTWTPTVGTELVATNGTARAGTVGEVAVNDAAANFVVSHHIGSYYKGGHPRTYFPGIRAAGVTGGSTLVASQITAMASAWANYQTALNAYTTGSILGVTLGTVRFARGNAWLAPPLFYPWQSHTVRSIIGTQRRRLLN